MKRFFILVLLTAAIVSFVEPVAAQFRSSVAQVKAGDVRNGNGFFVAPGLLMTAGHVVKDAKKVKVKYTSFWIWGQVVAKSLTHDLALIQINGTGSHAFDLCDVDSDSKVSMWGYRRGKWDRSRGIVLWQKPGLIRTSIIVAKGNSGSPLVQSRCAVGVVINGRASDMAAGVVPAAVAKEFLDAFLKGGE